MTNERIELRNISLSLADLLGAEYTDALCEARAFLDGRDVAAYCAIAEEKVDFFPPSFGAP